MSWLNFLIIVFSSCFFSYVCEVFHFPPTILFLYLEAIPLKTHCLLFLFLFLFLILVLFLLFTISGFHLSFWDCCLFYKYRIVFILHNHCRHITTKIVIDELNFHWFQLVSIWITSTFFSNCTWRIQELSTHNMITYGLFSFSKVFSHMSSYKGCQVQSPSVWNLRNHKMSCDLVKLSLFFKELVIPWVPCGIHFVCLYRQMSDRCCCTPLLC